MDASFFNTTRKTTPNTPPNTAIVLWDIPTRLLHWGLVAAIMVSVAAVKTAWLTHPWHVISGIAIMALVTFRLCWGFLGGRTARFKQFFPTLARLQAWRTGQWVEVGHSPIAGLSVFALLAVLAGLVVTGLFANDDISMQGPLARFASEACSDQASAWHAWLFNIGIGLVGLHLLAIAYYHWIKHDPLVPAMLHGNKPVTPALALQHTRLNAQLKHPAWLRFLVSLLITLFVTGSLTSQTLHDWIAPPPVAVPTARPAW